MREGAEETLQYLPPPSLFVCLSTFAVMFQQGRIVAILSFHSPAHRLQECASSLKQCRLARGAVTAVTTPTGKPATCASPSAAAAAATADAAIRCMLWLGCCLEAMQLLPAAG
jgi:hypothetical protein